MFAPWYNPTWCSQMLTIKTSETAIENKADLRSKSCNSTVSAHRGMRTGKRRTWSSPRSRPSVPSTSMTSTLISSPLDIQIPAVWYQYRLRVTDGSMLTLGGLPSLVLVHDIELGPKQSIQESTCDVRSSESHRRMSGG